MDYLQHLSSKWTVHRNKHFQSLSFDMHVYWALQFRESRSAIERNLLSNSPWCTFVVWAGFENKWSPGVGGYWCSIFSCPLRRSWVSVSDERGVWVYVMLCGVCIGWSSAMRSGQRGQTPREAAVIFMGPWVQSLGEWPISCNLGIGILRRTGMKIDVAAKKKNFAFPPQWSGTLTPPNPIIGKEQYLHALGKELFNMASGPEVSIGRVKLDKMVADFPALFSSIVGTAIFAPCEIKLSEHAPVRSQPYRCAPPKLVIFKNIVNELLAQGVVRPPKSPSWCLRMWEGSA
jgi:hypothetical protein